MAITMGSNTISGLTAGGLGSGVITTALIADGNVTASIVYNGNSWSASGNGYMYLPNGLLIQWCESGGQGGEADIAGSWPISFPTTILRVINGTTAPNGDRDGMMQLRYYDVNGYTVRANTFNSAGGTIYGDMIAIGY